MSNLYQQATPYVTGGCLSMFFGIAFLYKDHSWSSVSQKMPFQCFILKICFPCSIKQGCLKFQADSDTWEDLTIKLEEAMTTGYSTKIKKRDKLLKRA